MPVLAAILSNWLNFDVIFLFFLECQEAGYVIGSLFKEICNHWNLFNYSLSLLVICHLYIDHSSLILFVSYWCKSWWAVIGGGLSCVKMASSPATTASLVQQRKLARDKIYTMLEFLEPRKEVRVSNLTLYLNIIKEVQFFNSGPKYPKLTTTEAICLNLRPLSYLTTLRHFMHSYSLSLDPILHSKRGIITIAQIYR